MKALKIGDIVNATGGRLLCGSEDAVLTDISTDTRVIQPGMLFVALKGNTFDGHDYVQAALDKGAVGCVVSKNVQTQGNIILVEDTLKALGDIASFYRRLFSIPFVAVTGSVGKTTTKDMIACALAAKYNVLKTRGNFNNQIGLPLTLFGLSEQHQIGVTEMGMSGFGEIDALAKMVEPNAAVFTNIGLSHIEQLGSRENILKAKTEMLDHLKPDGYVVLCGDDDMLWSLKDKLTHKHVYYGIENHSCDILAKDIATTEQKGTVFTIVDGPESTRVEIPVLGEHNIKNALAAYAVAMHYGVDPKGFQNAMRHFQPGKMRQNILEVNGITVINDCYNASPSSVEAGLKTLSQIDKNRRKIAVLGDMLEMGKWSVEAHALVGKMVVDHKVDYLVTVGKDSVHIAKSAAEAGFPKEHLVSFETNAQVIAYLDRLIQPGDIVLIKASRGMKLEEIVENLVGF